MVFLQHLSDFPSNNQGKGHFTVCWNCAILLETSGFQTRVEQQKELDLSFRLKVGTGVFVGCFFTAMLLHVVLHFHHTNRLSKWNMIFGFWRQTHLNAFNKHKEVPSLTMWNYGPPANRWMERNGLKIEVCLRQNDRIVLLQTSWSKDRVSTHSTNKLWSTKDWIKVLRIGLPTLLLIIALCNYG